ncbi:MAG TPA: hypothetical protein VGN26_14125 [Armatimonadota bacterium]
MHRYGPIDTTTALHGMAHLKWVLWVPWCFVGFSVGRTDGERLSHGRSAREVLWIPMALGLGVGAVVAQLQTILVEWAVQVLAALEALRDLQLRTQRSLNDASQDKTRSRVLPRHRDSAPTRG